MGGKVDFMEKYIDEKFFRFMGMEIKEYDEQIKRIEALCEVDAIEKYGEEELRQKLINHLLVSEYTKEDCRNLLCVFQKSSKRESILFRGNHKYFGKIEE